MNVGVLTLFPNCSSRSGIMALSGGRFRRKKSTPLTIDIRDHAQGRHRVTDDRPYGGGCGMVMKPEPLTAALAEAKKRCRRQQRCCSLPRGSASISPWPNRWHPRMALILVCGRYEGVDERFIDRCVDAEVSIGDFVLTGGELGAMVVIDAWSRLIPGCTGQCGLRRTAIPSATDLWNTRIYTAGDIRR
jgi:tRNA (guanine37-N1)-methyltransferase